MLKWIPKCFPATVPGPLGNDTGEVVTGWAPKEQTLKPNGIARKRYATRLYCAWRIYCRYPMKSQAYAFPITAQWSREAADPSKRA